MMRCHRPECRRNAALLEAYVDGELTPDQVLTVEAQLADCESCAERVRFAEATRVSLQRRVRATAQPTPGFEDRLRARLRAEAEREESLEREATERESFVYSLPSLRSALPLVAAAALLLIWFSSPFRRQRHTEQPAPDTGLLAAGTLTDDDPTRQVADMVDHLLDELVEHHAAPTEPQVTEPALARHFEPEVGVPVKVPSLRNYGARWEGAGVVRVHNPALVSGPRNVRLRDQGKLRAVSMRYRLGGDHRVTVYVYDSRRVPLRVNLEARVVRDQPVFVGNRRGYSIAAVERRGVGYAVASDLDDRESAELVVASVH